ncbi:MAG: hypothetical protein AB7O66_18950 [Limisphaerales bacterium]
MLSLKPAVFQREFRAIGQLGRATHPSHFGPEFEAYLYETVRDKARFRTRTLGLRMSRRRFERLAWQVWDSPAARRRSADEASPPEGLGGADSTRLAGSG